MTLLEIIREKKIVTEITPANQSAKLATLAIPISDQSNKTVVTVASVAVTTLGIELAELKLEERRKKVLAMLDEKPDIQRTFITDMNSDSDNVIMTIAIRDPYTFEMQIPKNKGVMPVASEERRSFWEVSA